MNDRRILVSSALMAGTSAALALVPASSAHADPRSDHQSQTPAQRPPPADLESFVDVSSVTGAFLPNDGPISTDILRDNNVLADLTGALGLGLLDNLDDLDL